MTIPRGGLVYGMPLENVPDRKAQVRRYLDGLSVAVISEANIASYPDLIKTIRGINPACKIGLEVSAWGGLIKPSVYWPLRSALGQLAQGHSWWMQHLDGSFIETHNNFRLVDFTISSARDWYADRVRDAFAVSGVDFLFFDECHCTLGFLPNAERIKLYASSDRDTAWTQAMAKLCRRVGPVMVNGTINTATAPVMIKGRYIQNAVSGLAGSIAAAREHLLYQGPDLLVFEQPVHLSAQNEMAQVQLNGLVATFGGSCGLNIGGAFREPIPGTGLVPEDASQ